MSSQVSALLTRDMPTTTRSSEPGTEHRQVGDTCGRQAPGAPVWSTMCGVGRHSGDRPVATTTLPRRRIAWLTLGLSAALVAWGVLVWAAIDLGREARSGASEAWWVVVVATVGAAACLFVVLLLGARLLGILQGRESPPRPVRVPGGRRAAR